MFGRASSSAGERTRAVPQHFGVRTQTHKLIYFPRSDKWNLFDLQRDPHDTKSVHDDPAFSDFRKTLAADFARFREAYDAPPFSAKKQ